MQALMMDTPLMISSILKHAERNFPEVEMVSVTVDQPRHRQNNKVFASRCRKLAKALESLGAEFGDRIGTLAWNDFRHMELYYAVSGAGMVCHTINPKLFPEQVAYIINHADDKILFVDVLVVPLLEALQEHIKKVDCIVVLTDKVHMYVTKSSLRRKQTLMNGRCSMRTLHVVCATPRVQRAIQRVLFTAIVLQFCML
jgi:acyl-CoA synthetase (AMP-forming)/AMP-acid ligase II